MTNVSSTTYRNPVVRGLSPDPSVCRVGDDYFLATSSLDFWPGIPIRHSTDLVHWTVIGHAVTHPSQYRRDGRPGQLRLYAPTLRHHDGRFFLTCTNVAPGQGNFLVSADDPAGPWSAAVWIDAEGFDPSLTFADDAVYYTRRTVVPGKEGSGPVVQAEIDVETGRLLTPTRPITPGEAGFCSNDIEGPHLYRIGDWWYLLAAEGGTWKGHMATVARSRSPWGPFEGAPHNPVLTHRHRVGHPIQSTGHADLVDDVEGRWWAVFLGTRHIGPTSWHHLGRETFLSPVTWEDGWPTIGAAGTTELNVVGQLPPNRDTPLRQHRGDAWTSGLSTRQPPLDGVVIRPDDSSTIELPASGSGLDDGTQVSAVFLEQTEFESDFQVTLHAPPAAPAEAGLSVYASPEHHYDLVVSTLENKRTVSLRKVIGDLVESRSTTLLGEGAVTLRVEADGKLYRFIVRDTASRATDSVEVGTALARLVSAEASSTYSGIRFAVFARGAAASVSGVSLHSRAEAPQAAGPARVRDDSQSASAT